MRKTLLLVIILGVGLFCPALALAQPSPLIIDSNRADRTPAPNPPAGEAIAPPMQAASPAIAPFVLKEVRVTGTTLPARAIQAATRPFIGETIDTPGLQKIADALSAAYAKSDVALYTIAAPNQDFANGLLRIAVTEGYIANVDVKGTSKRDTRLIRHYGSKLTRERPLKRSTLQRYVSLIRDIAGLTADLNLSRSDAPGAATLSVAPMQKRVQVGLTVNNSGSALLGRYQMQTDVTYYGLFREGEATTFTFAAPTDVTRFQYYALSHAEPLDSEGTMGRVSFGYLNTRPKDVPVHGNAETLQFLVSHPLIRSFEESLYATLGIDGLDSRNAVIGQSVANERVRAVRAGLSYAHAYPKSVLSLAGVFSFGIDGLGAMEPSPIVGESGFVKFNASAAYGRELWETVFLRLHAAGQVGADRLPTSELSAYGGPEFGRAFAVASIIGDAGVAGSAEIAWRPNGLPERFNGSELYAFADREESWLRRRVSAGQTYALASAGVGVRIAVSAKTMLQLEAARVMDAPLAIARDGAWHFGVALTARY